MENSCSDAVEHDVGEGAAERGWIRELARVGEVRLSEQQLGIEAEPRVGLALGEDGLELGDQRVGRVELEDRLDLGRRLAELLEHLLHPRSQIVLVADQAYRR